MNVILDNSIAFYTKAFDLKLTNKLDTLIAMQPDGTELIRRVNMAFLKFPGQDFVFELAQQVADTSSRQTTFSFQHIGVDVLDIEAATEVRDGEVGEDQREAAIQREAGQRDDDRRHLQVSDEQSIASGEAPRRRDAGGEAGQGRPLAIDQNAEHGSRNDDDGSDRKIDGTGADDAGHAESGQDDRGDIGAAARENIGERAALLHREGDGNEQDEVPGQQDQQSLAQKG